MTSQVEVFAQTDRAAVLDGGGSERIVWIRLCLPAAEAKAKWPVHLGLAVDRSGSMSGRKLLLAQQAVTTAISRLGPNDSFAVVTYSNQVQVIVPLTQATAEARREAFAKVRAIYPLNHTNLSAGWLGSCEQVATGLSENAVGRVILITDGLANRGIEDPEVLAKKAHEQRNAHVLTSTIGVGRDFDELMLSRIADGGGGHFHYVKKSEQLPAAVDSIVGETLSVVACDARLRVQGPPGTVIESLNGYPTELAQDGSPSTSVLALGDLVSQQQLDLILRIKLPAGKLKTRCALQIALTDRRQELSVKPARVEWSFVGQADNDAQPRNEEVTRQAAKLFAAQARVQAWQLNREGKFELAKKVLVRVARTNRRVAGTDPEQLGLVEQLEREAEKVGQPLDSEESKDLFTRGYTTMRGLDEFSQVCRVGAIESLSALAPADALPDEPSPSPFPIEESSSSLVDFMPESPLAPPTPAPTRPRPPTPTPTPTRPPTSPAPVMRTPMRRPMRDSESNLGLWIFFGLVITLGLFIFLSTLGS